MSIVVQKFGGTSVSNNENLLNICKHIIKEYNKKNKVIVVVSAQGKTTNNLTKEAFELNENPNSRELDVLLSTGEQITISKLSIILNSLGYKAISLTGWQIPIITNEIANNADIKYINIDRILKELYEDKLVIIAGFQGINEKGDITTLGRGGSDTTAVAVAAAVGAIRCDIFTDVDGVYDKDPNKNLDAKKIKTISYKEMLKLANSGAKVLHNKCIEIGMKFDVPIYVKSSFEENTIGTFVGKIKD